LQPYQIEYYQAQSGRSPFKQWLLSLDKRDRFWLANRIDRMAAGNLGDHRHLERGLYEARFHFGPGYRAYLGIHQGQVILLIGGGDKATQVEDIFKALEHWAQYKESHP
jgi:putative addiction module killer protein